MAAVSARAETPIPAQDRPGALAQPLLTGDALETDLDSGRTVVKGQCTWRDGALLVTGDEFIYDRKSEILTASGHVTMTRGVGRMLADWFEYHRRDGYFRARNVRITHYPLCMQAATADGTEKEMHLHQATITYTDPGRWKPSAKAETIIYSPGKYVKLVGSLIGMTGAEVIPIKGLQQDLTSALTAEYFHFGAGYRSTLGGMLDVGLRVPTFPGAKFGGDLDFFTKRGAMIGPAGFYESPDGSGDLYGYLRSGYIHDYGDLALDTDNLGNRVGRDRAFAEWHHQQRITPDLTVAADINWWTDSQVLRDFNPKEFYHLQEPDNFVESTYSGADFLASAFIRLQPDSFEPVQQRLPELRFEMLPTAIGGGFYERFSAEAVSLLERPPGDGAHLGDDRLDVFYGISRPYAPVDWFTFTPVAGARLTDYSDTTGAAAGGGYLRSLGEVGFDAVMRASGTFGYKNAVWDIDGLRHLVTPSISYRYIPEADKGRQYIPAIDRWSFSPDLQPLELGDIRSIDQLRATNTVRIGLDNLLQTRDPGYGSRELLDFAIADDLNFHRSAFEPDFSDLHTHLSITPARWIEVYNDEIFGIGSFSLREFNSGIIIRDGSAWSMQFGSAFLRHNNDDYSLNCRGRINEQFSALFMLEYGARQHRFNQQAVGVEQVLANTWRIQYLVTASRGPNPEGHFGFQVNIEALRF